MASKYAISENSPIEEQVEAAETFGFGDCGEHIAVIVSTHDERTVAGLCDKEAARLLLSTLIDMMAVRGWMGDT
jgi:hypothetical protein